MIAINTMVMKQSERVCMESGVSDVELMLRASRAIFNEVVAYPNRLINIFCGSGNNGGDGYALAILLDKAHIPFAIYSEGPTTAECAKHYYDICSERFLTKLLSFTDVSDISSDVLDNGVAIDCVYGNGFHGELSEGIRAVTAVINRFSIVISCDIPSGLNGNNGIASLGAVKADTTLAIGAIKVGCLLSDGRDYSGEIKVCDIGINIIGESYTQISEADCMRMFPTRHNNSHKGDYGKVKIIACSECYVGAGILTSSACVNVLGESALGVGAGLCVLNVPDAMLESMWKRVLHCTLERRSKLTLNGEIIAYGMGVGTESGLLPKLLEQTMPLLIDADGINELARNIDILRDKKCQVVLTPHPKEMSRLCGCTVQEVLDNPIETAKNFAKTNNVVVLLKGCSTIITDGEKVTISTTGTPAMAKGGSGDVLSGVIVGLIARGGSLYDSACVGAYIMGRAGELAMRDFTADTLVAYDTVSYLKAVIKDILDRNKPL